MNPVIQLVCVKHGSNLYGTATPTSDLDYKGVHLPSGEAIILGRAENVIDTSVVVKNEAGKNQAESIDNQSFSLQKFFEMLMKGDTVATEILFAAVPHGSHHTANGLEYHPLWPQVHAVGVQLLNRQCKGFVGYCVRQAAKYGIKGSRMAAVKSLLDLLDVVKLGLPNTQQLGTIKGKLQDWSHGREHVSWENIPSQHGTDIWHLNVCDRKMPMTASIKDAYAVYNKVWENYGERARQAMTNEGIDWKAMSHAVRVAEQAIELLRTGKITFPRPNADVLLAIKKGECKYDDVSKLLEMLVARVQEVSLISQLPEKSNHKLADALVREYYLRQVQ